MSDITADEIVNFSQNYDMPKQAQMAAAAAAMPKESKGMAFDFNNLFGRLQSEGFDSLDPASKELLWQMKEGVRYSPEDAAKFTQSFYEKQRELSTPQAQAESKRIQVQTELTQQNLQKAKTETLLTESELRDKYTAKKMAADSLGRVLDSIQKLKTNQDGRLWSTGGTSILPASPGSKAADFNAELNFLISGATMQARDQLKGTGTITDKETDIAAGAEARLDPKQSEEKFLAGLNDLESFYRKKQEQLLSTPVERIPGVPMAQPNSAAAFHQAPPQAAPAQPAAPQSRVIRGQRFVQLPNGNWIPQ